MKSIKRVLCLVSGGLDSTYMVLKYLEKGYYVDMLYVVISNNKNKTSRELISINKFIKYINNTKYKESYTFTKTDKIYVNVNDNKYFQIILPLIYSLLDYIEKYHTTVSIGYVVSDDMVSFIDDIKKIWNSFKGIYNNLPTITFPILKTHKIEIYNTLPDELKKSITWCESSDKVDTSCGNCIPCKKMILHGLMNSVIINKIETSNIVEVL